MISLYIGGRPIGGWWPLHVVDSDVHEKIPQNPILVQNDFGDGSITNSFSEK